MASSTPSTSLINPTVASPFALTTAFTAPSQCAQSVGGLTMLQNKAYQIWLNELQPVPGTTITSCYPPQFVSSYLKEKGGQSQAAFSPLVCPEGYVTQGPFTSNYIACCPSGWNGLALHSAAPSNRPASGGTCYTNIYNKPIAITQYDDSRVLLSSLFTATDVSAQAYAIPYEGFAFGVANLASLTSSSPSVALPTGPLPTSPGAELAPAQSRRQGLPRNALIATVITSVLGGVILLALLVLFLRYRRKRRINSHQQADHPPDAPWKYPTDSQSTSTFAGGSSAGSEPATPATMPATTPAAMELAGKSRPREMHVVEKPAELEGGNLGVGVGLRVEPLPRRHESIAEGKTVLGTERDRENEKFRFDRDKALPRITVQDVHRPR